MWLQSKNRFNEGCVLNADESIGSIMPKADLAAASALCGSFGRVESDIAFFYRWQGILTFRFGQTRSIRFINVTTEWSANGKIGRFTIRKDQDVIFDKDFILCPDLLNIESDPTAFSEAEDFDFLLFVHNVQSSPERRELIYR